MILAIESSCDDTSVAIVELDGSIVLQKTISQIEHASFGGVVPELASRNHLLNLQIIVGTLLQEHKIPVEKLSAVCSTVGPGLFGGLMVGGMYGKGIADSLCIPFFGINHLEGHLLSPSIEHKDFDFPFINFIISGGHCQIVMAKKLGDYKIIAETMDDSIGELFDKVGRMLGIPYPAGQIIDNLAAKGKHTYDISSKILSQHNTQMSFSGLKTKMMHLIKDVSEDRKINQSQLENICCSMQMTIAKAVYKKLTAAIKIIKETEDVKRLAICGGVASNSAIRKVLH
ncbi:tRNA (adenosine(37)-N6)-threonylcarbamoyltransferase complex transferase subunit TsaD, partial [Rickettsiales bacterium]|nr:tRNA (adenosine(37)-N6)-threonylcarbamoyltransferase complex transferase subunit TsaD [Rickettsiales bacterium]